MFFIKANVNSDMPIVDNFFQMARSSIISEGIWAPVSTFYRIIISLNLFEIMFDKYKKVTRNAKCAFFKILGFINRIVCSRTRTNLVNDTSVASISCHIALGTLSISPFMIANAYWRPFLMY